MAASTNDVLSWTNQDPLLSLHLGVGDPDNPPQTVVSGSGQSTTTLWRAVRANREDRVAKLEWASNGGLGRAVIGKNAVPMSDLVRPDPRHPGARIFNAPDGLQYRWRPSSNTPDVLLEDPAGNVVAFFRPTRATRYQIGDVYGELHFLRNADTPTHDGHGYGNSHALPILPGIWSLTSHSPPFTL
ncbi:hypothetical protein J3R82DRAFT_4000 [Butyriboletus roseoflavus]|nr:hypothetical protein J3R82DRAFT_4000 [Butyriboletus roseoflavus]